MALPDVFANMLEFLRAGYPENTPGPDRVPMFALMRRRLTDDEVLSLARESTARGERPIDGTLGAAITKLTDEMPSPADTDRVKQCLPAGGWPVTGQFRSSGN
jgi:Protein of unknown function (DUF3349)